MIEPTKLEDPNVSTGRALNGRKVRDVPEECDERDEGEDGGADDDGPLVFVQSCLKCLLVLILDVLVNL